MTKEQDRQNYIKEHNLEDSYIDKKILYQYRNVIPERMLLATSRDNKYKIFFEETRGSLVKRNYGKSEKVTSWNLLISNNKMSNKITKENINVLLKFDNFIFYDGYSKITLIDFINKNCKRFNGLEKKEIEMKNKSIWCNDEEFKLIKEFLRKLRARR